MVPRHRSSPQRGTRYVTADGQAQSPSDYFAPPDWAIIGPTEGTIGVQVMPDAIPELDERYTINGRHRSKSFRTRIEAERYRGLLLQAVQDCSRFDETTNEPEVMANTARRHARSRVDKTLAERTMGRVGRRWARG